MRADLLLVPSFLDHPTCRALARVGFTPPPGRHDIPAHSLFGAPLIDGIVHRVSDALAAHFGITDPLFCDYAAVTRTEPGMGHVEHADAETPDGAPNHTSWRLVTAMLYLNSWGYEFGGGGELRFPRLVDPLDNPDGVCITPAEGLLVGFRCDGLHTHSVPPVGWGVRSALAFWFTLDRTYEGRVSPVLPTVVLPT